jgi:V/A-type H+/Na+-transporting ATPase subunit I
MLRPQRMKRVELGLLQDDAPRAALLLADYGSFAPEFTEVSPASLPELPGESYRRTYQTCRTHLDRILAHFDMALPIESAAPLQPVTEDQLVPVGAWLREVWTRCSEEEERLRKLREDHRRTGQLLQGLGRFMNLNIDLTRLHTGSALLDVRVGTLPADNLKRFEEALHLAGYTAIRFFAGEGLVHLIIAGAAGQAGEIERVLQAANWHATEVPAEFHGQPIEVRAELTERMLRLDRQAAEEARQRRAQSVQPEFRARLLEAARMLLRAAPYVRLSALMRGRGHLAAASGWVPESELPRLRRDLQEHLVGRFVLSAREPRSDEHLRVPSLVRHRRWLRPFAALVLTYGVPRYDEIDPTVPFAASYVLMFGMMFGDLGQGAAVALAGLLLRKRLGDYGSLVISVGVSSALFGVLYGSVFSYERLIPALWVAPLSNPMLMLRVALGWGIGFIVLATLLTIYNRLVEGRLRDALLDSHGAAGLVAYLGLLAGAWRLLTTGRVGIAIPVVVCAALGVMLEDGWQKNCGSAFGERALIALVEGYEAIMAYISNTLSFLRLAAFSLNHVALAIAIFTLANMLHRAGYWVTVVLGNGLILVLEGAIVAIQAIRLEYYEGFSRFFSGDGRPFQPLALGSEAPLELQNR